MITDRDWKLLKEHFESLAKAQFFHDITYQRTHAYAALNKMNEIENDVQVQSLIKAGY